MNVLIVDDEPTNLALCAYMLEALPDVTAIEAADPQEALDWCRDNEPDVVLLDYMMPAMDGLQFLQRFRALPGREQIPVIMLTADVQTALRHRALQLSANDFLNKPVDKTELRARVRNMLSLRASMLQLRQRADGLDHEVRDAREALQLYQEETVQRLSRAAEFRDPETGAHLMRMAHYAQHIATRLGLDAAAQQLLLAAAPMHDIGKVGIPDHILCKPGRLDAAELAIMRTHAQIGADILAGSRSPLLQTAAAIALAHHEKYDGSGYPHGLRGEQIPLFARIVAVADVFDALTSARPYKRAWGLDEAAAFLHAQRGLHFDPVCLDAFFGDWEAVCAIHRRYPDEHGDAGLPAAA